MPPSDPEEEPQKENVEGQKNCRDVQSDIPSLKNHFSFVPEKFCRLPTLRPALQKNGRTFPTFNCDVRSSKRNLKSEMRRRKKNSSGLQSRNRGLPEKFPHSAMRIPSLQTFSRALRSETSTLKGRIRPFSKRSTEFPNASS
jgi:hypothetical protein